MSARSFFDTNVLFFADDSTGPKFRQLEQHKRALAFLTSSLSHQDNERFFYHCWTHKERKPWQQAPILLRCQ